MIVFSVIAYIAIAVWYFLGNEKNQRISTVIGTCLSSFLAFWYWEENNIAMIVYFIMGIACIFFHWIAVPSKNKTPQGKNKNRIIAACLALFLGGYGAHRFYLRKSTSGLVYVLFSWCLIPGIIGTVEAIILFTMKQEKFDALYNPTGSESAPKTACDQPPATEKMHWNDHSERVTDEDVFAHDNTNERDGDILNYRDIRVCGYKAQAVGSVEDFTIVVNTNGNTYTFQAKNGDICTYRSSSMRQTKHYEVT